MKFHFKITEDLQVAIIRDLERPHRHASERVGFLRTHQPQTSDGTLILAREYLPVADEHYLPDRWVGARIDANAIRHALEWSDGWPGGVFHIHKHLGTGVPGFSPDDHDGNARLVPAFFNISPTGFHGAVVLSDDSLFGAVWTAKKAAPIAIAKLSVVGTRTRRWRW